MQSVVKGLSTANMRSSPDKFLFNLTNSRLLEFSQLVSYLRFNLKTAECLNLVSQSPIFDLTSKQPSIAMSCFFFASYQNSIQHIFRCSSAWKSVCSPIGSEYFILASKTPVSDTRSDLELSQGITRDGPVSPLIFKFTKSPCEFHVKLASHLSKRLRI